MVFTSSLVRPQQRYPTRCQSPADPVTRTDTSASVSSMGALRHGGRWESGHVRVGIGMPCIPACATTTASQGPRRGSVPERGSSWINAKVSWCRSHACVAPLALIHRGCHLASPMGELAQGAWVCRALHDAAAGAACHRVACSSAYTSQQAWWESTCQAHQVISRAPGSHSRISPAAGRRRLHLRQRISLPPCNRSAQLGWVLYPSTTIGRWGASGDGQAARELLLGQLCILLRTRARLPQVVDITMRSPICHLTAHPWFTAGRS